MSEVKKEVKSSRKADIVKIILALLAVLMGTYIFVDPGKSEFTFDQAAVNKIDSLQRINDTLKSENIQLDSLLQEYRLVISDLDYKMSNLVKTKQEIENYYRDRNRTITGSAQEPTDLDTFFMNRYLYEGSSNE
jgi:hypothetical protein